MEQVGRIIEQLANFFSSPTGMVVAGVVGLIAIAWAWVRYRDRWRWRTKGNTWASDEYSQDDDTARALAIGYIQLANSGCFWNDPTGSRLKDREIGLRNLREMWGLGSYEDWQEAVADLVNDKRADELRDTLLPLRSDLADSLGRRPTKKEWIEEVKKYTQALNDDAKAEIELITYFESKLKKAAGLPLITDDATVRNLHAFAYGQAVAVCVWGVAAGVVSEAEAVAKAKEISAVARREYGSWQAYGQSYILGRACFFYDRFAGKNAEKAVSQQLVACQDYREACAPASSKNPGPWTRLAW